MTSADKQPLDDLPAVTTPINGAKSSAGKKKTKSHNKEVVTPTSVTQPPTGQASLPLARVKRIIKLDEDVRACSNSAAFAVTVATEMFIQYMCEQGLHMSRSDRRKTLHYKDLANAVHKLDELEFLSDVIPRTIPLHKVLKDRRARAEAEGVSDPMPDIEPAVEAGTDGAIPIPGAAITSVHKAKPPPVHSLPKGQTTLIVPMQPVPAQTESQPQAAVVLPSDPMDED
ncbi:histone-fold-containing protein [Lipomyces mesembrius]